ncbi:MULTISPECIES: hypothetical protein [Lactobacillales]|uniref:Uncharacterized protein n=1 Tax=Ruoffia tabacinasalis TaxID=87458 RepID=A0A5R9DRM1_9LACT|nr:hypothetical protein [Ruoffia tabacinasalis]TLQ38450.1 hypothetical protein FEZ33_11890 [Ruoffia tabacinasalis]
MKLSKKIIVIFTLFLSISPLFSTPEVNAQQNNVVPYGTITGPGGTTTLEIMSSNTVYWYAKPSFSGPYTFQGTVTVTYKNNRTNTFWISEAANSKSVSGIIELPAAAKKAVLSGVAIGTNGLAIAVPNADAYNY